MAGQGNYWCPPEYRAASSASYLAQKECEFDIFLNLGENKQELRISAIGITDNEEYHELISCCEDKDNFKTDLVPYLNFHVDSTGAECRIAEVPIEWYGKEAQIWK